MGLMVGLVISLLVVLAMLFLYRGVLNSVFGTRETPGLVPSAQQDGQLSSGLLSAQIALQAAGFGIPNAAVGSEVVFLSGASFDPKKLQLSGTVQTVGSAETVGNAIVFESNPALSGDPGARECVGLWSDPSDDHGLYLLKSVAPCSPIASHFASQKWTAYALVAARSMPTSIGMTARTDASCWPFGTLSKDFTGIDPPNGLLQLSITYRNSTVGTGISGSPNTLLVCLTNFQS